MAKDAAQKREEPVTDKEPAVKLVERKIDAINHTRMKPQEYLRSMYLATANTVSTQPEDLKDPAYWAHVGQQLKRRDVIEVWADDGSWMATCIVLGADRSSAKVHVREVIFFDANAMQAGDDALAPYKVVERGPHAKWSVVRKSDDAVVHEGEETRAGAEFWMRERQKADK